MKFQLKYTECLRFGRLMSDMDHKLVEFVARIPAHLKVRGRSRRYLQTRVAERYLPTAVTRRKKIGFSSALPYLLANEFRQLFRTFLSDSYLVRDGYLKGEAIGHLLAEHLLGRVDHGNRLWLLFNAEVWYRMFSRDWTKEMVKERLIADEASGKTHVYT